LSIGDVSVTDDASLEAFRSRYAGTSQPSLPLVLRRGAETITAQVPVRLVGRARIRVVPVPGAPAKAVAIRHAIVSGMRAP
jgi:hypothetical protein